MIYGFIAFNIIYIMRTYVGSGRIQLFMAVIPLVVDSRENTLIETDIVTRTSVFRISQLIFDSSPTLQQKAETSIQWNGPSTSLLQAFSKPLRHNVSQ